MIPVVIYLLKVFLCSALLAGYYYVALRNKVFHQWNRFYLLLAVLLSLLVPLFQFTIFHTPDEAEQGAIKLLHAVQSPQQPVIISSSQNYFYLLSSLSYLYAFISFIFLCALLFSLVRIAQLIEQHHKQELQNIYFINTEVKGTPFSFFRYIFWNSAIDINSHSGKQIFKHELVHVREWHTLDKLFMQTVLIFFWYNPLFWIIRFELRMIHEFIADKKAVQHQDASELATIILQTAYPKNFAQIINPFFQQSIKRRLVMLTNIENPRLNYASRVFILPLIAFTILAFSVKAEAITESESSAKPLKKGTELPVQEDKSEVIASAFYSTKTKTDTLPKKKEIKEVNVKEKTVEVIYKDGTKEELSVQEAYQRKIITINSNQSSERTVLIGSSTPTEALIIVDGKPYTEGLNTLPPNVIKRLNVIKGTAALAKYGDEGKNGVIEITLKKGHETSMILEADSITVTGRDNNSSIQITSIELTKIKKDTAEDYGMTFTKTEIDPEFLGGVAAWRKYLERNLDALVPVKNKAPIGTYTVVAQFIVAKDGTVSDVKAITKHGYGMEEEVIRVIKNGPKWKPAIQNGKEVRAYKKQPITFMVASN